MQEILENMNGETHGKGSNGNCEEALTGLERMELNDLRS